MSETATPVAPATSRPGNVTVRELAATLSKSAPPQSEPSPNPEVPPAEPTPAAARVPAATPTGAEPVSPAEPPVNEPSPEPEPETKAELADLSVSEVPAVPETETDPAKSSLPPELADALALAKGDGKKGVADLLGRVHKLVDQRDTERNARLSAEEKAAKLEAELAQAREAKPAEPSALAPGQHPEVAKVTKQIANVDHWLNECEANPDGLKVPDGQGGEIELDAAGVRSARQALERQRQELIAEKVQVSHRVKETFQRDYETSHATAVKAYPEIFKKDSPEAQLGEQLLKAVPGLKQWPDYELVIGRYINGCKLELARTKSASSGPARKAPAPVEPPLVPTERSGAGNVARPNGVSKAVQEAEDRYRKSGRTSDLAKLNAAKAQANRALK